jgi:Fe-Mn family superoxide dismutase
MKLPYDISALEPFMSKETLEYHYGKHHQAYVNTLNTLIEGTEHAEKDLENIITSSDGKIFNNAAQIWNHNLLWDTLKINN